MQPHENLGPVDIAKLALMVRRFHQAVEVQRRRDGEILAGLVRVLRNPRSDAARVEVEQFVELFRSIISGDASNAGDDSHRERPARNS
jgi:hypothetical protein